MGDCFMLLNKDISDATYSKFIQYALNTSDAFMVIVKHCDAVIFNSSEMLNNISKINIDIATSPEVIENYRKREDDSKKKFDSFQNNCLPFLMDLEPYLLKRRHNPDWPSTRAIARKTDDYDINVYSFTKDTKTLLLAPNSYLNWKYPYYPEDLSIFRKGRCWAYSSSHEEYIEIFPSSISEYDMLVDMGIDFFEPYTPTPTDQLYFEQY